MKSFLNWMNDGELIPYSVAIPLLLMGFFVPMMLFAGIDAPLVWLNGVYEALLAIK